MIFKLNIESDSFLEEIYEKAMIDLGQFFGINWIENRPKIFILPNRRAFDEMEGKETPRWEVGFTRTSQMAVYLLDRKNYEKESENTYSEEIYAALLKHELCHCFWTVKTRGYSKPRWLSEGLCVYLSGQLEWKKKPEKLESFLNSFEKTEAGVYTEGGYAAKFLVEKYGKEKMLELLKRLSEKPDESGFKKLFVEIYGVELSYSIFVKM